MSENGKEIFTLSYYEEFVRRLCEKYLFTTFREGKKDYSPGKLLIRHDIDMDLETAVRMSLIEESVGLRATYFFMVRCPLYNVFGESGAEQVQQILNRGHYFGLHFDCAPYQDINAGNIDYYVQRECSLLEQFFNRPIEAISFHRPGQLELSGIELSKWPHTYEKIFLEKFKYFSDSRGTWAYGNPLESEAFANRENLHILVHPVWWTQSPASPYEKLVSLLQQVSYRNEQYISTNCQVWNEGKRLRNLIE